MAHRRVGCADRRPGHLVRTADPTIPDQCAIRLQDALTCSPNLFVHRLPACEVRASLEPGGARPNRSSPPSTRWGGNRVLQSGKPGFGGAHAGNIEDQSRGPGQLMGFSLDRPTALSLSSGSCPGRWLSLLDHCNHLEDAPHLAHVRVSELAPCHDARQQPAHPAQQ